MSSDLSSDLSSDVSGEIAGDEVPRWAQHGRSTAVGRVAIARRSTLCTAIAGCPPLGRP